MRERFAITDFNSGIISRADAEDIPDNAASDSNNIDGDSAEGKLQAIPTASQKTNTYAYSSRLFDWIKTKDNKWNLVHIFQAASASTIQVLKDFYGTLADSGLGVTSICPTSIVSNGEAVHIANVTATTDPTPLDSNWTGYCDYEQFATGGTHLGWKSLAATVARPILTTDYVITVAGTGTGEAFTVNHYYDYAISFVYDGVQESPLGNYSLTVGQNRFSMSTVVSYVTVSITIKTIASMNPRITGIKLYRRECDEQSNPLTLFRLQQEMTIADATVAYIDRSLANISWGTSGGDKTVTYVDNNTDVLSSYEEQSGMPETLTTSSVKYTLNTSLNGFHFVGGCLKDGLPDAPMMMFRSKQYRYDMFDWTNDYLKLPTYPTAIKSFAGKIWAFDENHIYRINPDGFYIEDTTDGIGCLSQRSVVITDYGMFWCDYKNAYWHDGEKIDPIGDAIRTDISSTYDWMGFAKDYTSGSQFLTPIVVFHALKNYVLFIEPNYAASAGDSNVWAFHVAKKRWDKWLALTACGASTEGFGAFSGKDGEVYISTGAEVTQPLGHATDKRAFYWISKVLDFGQPGRLKRIKAINSDKTALTATPTITYGAERATPTTSFSAIVQAKLFQVKVAEATGYANIVYSIEILFRRLDEL